MDALDYRILTKRQELRDLLRFALSQSTVFLPMVRDLKLEISVCDCALNKLYRRHAVRAVLR